MFPPRPTAKGPLAGPGWPPPSLRVAPGPSRITLPERGLLRQLPPSEPLQRRPRMVRLLHPALPSSLDRSPPGTLTTAALPPLVLHPPVPFSSLGSIGVCLAPLLVPLLSSPVSRLCPVVVLLPDPSPNPMPSPTWIPDRPLLQGLGWAWLLMPPPLSHSAPLRPQESSAQLSPPIPRLSSPVFLLPPLTRFLGSTQTSPPIPSLPPPRRCLLGSTQPVSPPLLPPSLPRLRGPRPSSYPPLAPSPWLKPPLAQACLLGSTQTLPFLRSSLLLPFLLFFTPLLPPPLRF